MVPIAGSSEQAQNISVIFLGGIKISAQEEHGQNVTAMKKETMYRSVVENGVCVCDGAGM